ncbi:MAG: hypothetical protein M3373_07355 [Gemmatimonadota bacterium]|nr:hypothetical protein [Gemmatimonadota bacterium]
MSRVSTKSATGAPPTLAELAALGPKLMTLSFESARDFARQASAMLGPAMPKMPAMPSMRRAGMCDIPESECPPRCVCEIGWEASPGETLRCTIRVTNTSKGERPFTLEATPFAGPGDSPGTVTLTPASLTVGGGQSAIVTATFTVPQTIAPGDYESEIFVRGAYEQCVRVTLGVQRQAHCSCDVEQGDPPLRIRAHHWYDHFQCGEPCAPASRRQPVDDPQEHPGDRPPVIRTHG